MDHIIKELGEGEWQEAFQERMKLINYVLGVKAKEYIRNGNRLHNFDEAGRTENQLPARALHGMVLKHYQGYRDMLSDMEQPFGVIPSHNQIRERFGDIINYFILQEVIFLRHYGYINAENKEQDGGCKAGSGA
jgi:hypothetical protein